MVCKYLVFLYLNVLKCTLKWRSFAELCLGIVEISKNQNIWRVWVDTVRQPEKQKNATTEMQKVNLFHYLTNWRTPKKHPGRDRRAGMFAQSGSFHPGSWQDCCLLLFIEGLHTGSLPLCSNLPSVLSMHSSLSLTIFLLFVFNFNLWFCG